MEGIEIPIGADIKNFQKGVNQVENELKDLGSKADKSGKGLNSFTSASHKAGGAVGAMGKSTANAVPAVTEFSRVIQDAPYGMQGVANNLQQLTANFGHLKASAGGTIPALKAMLSSLAGPAGILLAVSAVTSAIVYFGAKSRKAGNDVASLKEQQDKLKESMDNYVLSLEAVNRANLKGEQSAAKELVNLSLLKSQVNDTTLSLNRRKDAVAELRKLYPDYLKNMTDEKILNGGLATVYDTLTGSIKERARATASMNAIIKNTENILVLESQRAAVSKQLADEEARVNLEMQKINKVASNNPMAGLAKSGVNASSKLLELRKNLNSIKGEIQSLELTNIDLEGNVKTNQGISGIAESIIPKDTPTKINQSVKAIGLQLNASLAELVITPPQIPILQNALTQLDIDRLTLQAKLLEMNAEINDIIQNGTVQALAGIGDAIGSAMAGAGNLASNLGKSLLSTLGSVLTQLGMMAIKIGVGIKAIKLALKSLNPAVAIAAGVGLVALGSFFSNQSAKIADGGGGGTNAGSSSGSSGGGFTGGFSGSSGNQTVVFEIAGTKLVGVLSNTLQRNRNLGGSLSLV